MKNPLIVYFSSCSKRRICLGEPSLVATSHSEHRILPLSQHLTFRIVVLSVIIYDTLVSLDFSYRSTCFISRMHVPFMRMFAFLQKTFPSRFIEAINFLYHCKFLFLFPVITNERGQSKKNDDNLRKYGCGL